LRAALRRLVRNAGRQWRINSRRHDISVFFYHGVVESRSDERLERHFHLLSDFREHLSLFRRARVLRLDEIADTLSTPSRHRSGGIAITFDDGFANNLLAHELLREAGLPWALFVTTAGIDRQSVLWTTELSLLLLRGDQRRLNALDRMWQLHTTTDRQSAYDGIRGILKRLAAPQRIAVMDQIRDQFPDGETHRLLDRFCSLQMLRWADVRMLARDGVEIGSHGIHHELHHDAQVAAVRRFELEQSKLQLEERLGQRCPFFAFPNGDASASSPAELATAGYDLGFTTEARVVRPNDNPHTLPRMTSAHL
jgi:peptidoglycan/xylan/chitin deacetylase (PgdA/CDA1 family)